MKKSMIIGKRQLILAGLICALGLAVFLNWKFASTDQELDLTAALNSSKYLGDAQYVNKSTTVAANSSDQTDNSGTEDSSFFEQSRKDRETAREKSLANLQDIMNDVKADGAAKTAAASEAAKIAKNVELENAAETLIKAKGFSDCVVIIADDTASVIVKSDGLLASETVQINDIITSQAKISLENIKIIEVK